MKSTPGSTPGPGAGAARIARWCLLGVVLIAVLEEPPVACAIPHCKPFASPPEDCRFGEVHDYCGRRVCAKGPGERCGGLSNIQGKCGEGMHCKCERCIGCSEINFACYLGSNICI